MNEQRVVMSFVGHVLGALGMNKLQRSGVAKFAAELEAAEPVPFSRLSGGARELVFANDALAYLALAVVLVVAFAGLGWKFGADIDAMGRVFAGCFFLLPALGCLIAGLLHRKLVISADRLQLRGLVRADEPVPLPSIQGVLITITKAVQDGMESPVVTLQVATARGTIELPGDQTACLALARLVPRDRLRLENRY